MEDLSPKQKALVARLPAVRFSRANIIKNEECELS